MVDYHTPTKKLIELFVSVGLPHNEATTKANEIREQVIAATDLVLHGGGLNAMREYSLWNHDIVIHRCIAQMMYIELEDHGVFEPVYAI